MQEGVQNARWRSLELVFGDKGLTIVPGVGVGHKDAGCLVTWHLDHILWLPVSTGSSFIYKFIFLPSKPDCLISLFISMGGTREHSPFTSGNNFRRRQWQATPVLLPRKSHGRRSLVGYSPWGREESDTTERLHFHFSLSHTGEGNGNPLQCSCLENPRDGEAWWAAVYGVAQSRTRLKRLSSNNNNFHGSPEKCLWPPLAGFSATAPPCSAPNSLTTTGRARVC